MSNFYLLCIHYQNLVNNLNNQVAYANNFLQSNHTMEYIGQEFETFYGKDAFYKNQLDFANEFILSQNADYEMYLNWMTNNEFTRSEKR